MVTCEEKHCKNKLRVCVSEPSPLVCEDGPGTCHQSMKAKCKRPSSCQAINCPVGKECFVVEGAVARCRLILPSSCEQLECEEGEECKVVERKKKNKSPRVKCVRSKKVEP